MAQTVFEPWEDPDQKPLIQFRNVTKRFGAFTAIDNLSLDIFEREFFALLGPSGCGKTTMMRMLAGFEAVSEGAIYLSGQDIGPVPPNKRAVNMMFQSYALFRTFDLGQHCLWPEARPTAQERDRGPRVRDAQADPAGKVRPPQTAPDFRWSAPARCACPVVGQGAQAALAR